jgi:putative transposase
LSWRLSNSLDADFCIEALEEALKYGKPRVFNSDQGVQFTSQEFTEILIQNGISISMDSCGRAYDNIFVERLWRTVKYEDIYLKGYENMLQAKEGLTKYFNFYNTERPHQALEYKTPWEIYSGIKDLPVEKEKEAKRKFKEEVTHNHIRPSHELAAKSALCECSCG